MIRSANGNRFSNLQFVNLRTSQTQSSHTHPTCIPPSTRLSTLSINLNQFAAMLWSVSCKWTPTIFPHDEPCEMYIGYTWGLNRCKWKGRTGIEGQICNYMHHWNSKEHTLLSRKTSNSKTTIHCIWESRPMYEVKSRILNCNNRFACQCLSRKDN